ncbi:MAG: hypothetical protein U1A25_01490, partial [Candidatus Sungbacteria bacterium]|nr:hypothetical protein [Candidatus Sungbacteria bacterium]
FLPALGLVTVTAVLIFFSPFRGVSSPLAKNVAECNNILKQNRFSCFRAALERNYKGGDLGFFVKSIEQDTTIDLHSQDNSYAIFGTNSHTFYHALGDLMATYDSRPIEDIVSLCPLTSTSGCAMGLHKRIALRNAYMPDTHQSFYAACRNAEKHQCAHEIGHTLHDEFMSSILQILDDITEKQFGLAPAKQYQYVSAKKQNLNAPFETCKKVLPEEEWNFCFTGIGHNMFLFAEFSPEGFAGQFKSCEEVPQINRDACLSFLLFRIGINEAAPRFLSNDIEGGNKICADALKNANREDLAAHCYKGIGGGIGLFLESEFPLLRVHAATRAMQREILRGPNLCEQAPKQFRTECLMGILGTRYLLLYKQSGVRHEGVEILIPQIGNFEVTS